MKVTGVDLSLTGTGLASIDDQFGEPYVHTKVLTSKPDNGTVHNRYKRLEAIASRVIKFCEGSNLVVIEGPSYASAGRGTFDRAGLWWWVVSILELTEVPCIEVPPNTRRKWATNNGQASKAAVAVAVGRMWPEVTTVDDNDADALALATIGAQILGMTVPERAHQPASLTKLLLPEKW